MSASSQPHTPRTPAIMVVGTASCAGKSIVATGLCRYYARRGINVAPFKAQNMSLNSFVTREGGEIGRAQVAQAWAAGLEPHTDMNPILLKPTGPSGSQVILNGIAVGNVPATDYMAMKARMREAAHAAYDRLSTRHDLIILEGAGSPAEINLQDGDIVNMSMAEYADAATILVADIDRGGVFASILGTLTLIPEHQRKLIRGVLINKFHGDVNLLAPGIKQIEELTNCPVLGVLPHLHNLRIDDEDAVSLETRSPVKNAQLDIVVLQLPHISNFTDFLPLEILPNVSLRFVSDPADVGQPDLLIIPGTKNTISDMRALRAAGWESIIRQRTTSGMPLIGICGGYQMLGEAVNDPDGVEGPIEREAGFGLLPVTTTLQPRKRLVRTQGVTGPDFAFGGEGIPFEGYEIHAGATLPLSSNNAPLLLEHDGTQGEPHGCISENGTVMGCYIHGLFDSPSLRNAVLNRLCEIKGVPAPEWPTEEFTPVTEYDRVADALQSHVDMGAFANLLP